MNAPTLPIGALLRHWRQRRRLSQLDLACSADISTRHLSFVETGRAQPSREMLLHLAEHLEIPLRERNRLLASAGFAPLYPQHSLDDPALDAARQAIGQLLKAHEPNPALAIDRHWNLLAANDAVMALVAGVSPALLVPPINALRLSLHPEGLAPRILNLGTWRACAGTWRRAVTRPWPPCMPSWRPTRRRPAQRRRAAMRCWCRCCWTRRWG